MCYIFNNPVGRRVKDEFKILTKPVVVLSWNFSDVGSIPTTSTKNENHIFSVKIWWERLYIIYAKSSEAY